MTDVAALHRLYATLPGVRCRGHCWPSCGPIAMTMLEAQRIEQHTGRPLGRVREADQFTCPYLGVHRQCTVYEARPAICRLYGVAEGLECDFGCIPERYLTPDEVHVFFKALGELSPIMAFTFGEG